MLLPLLPLKKKRGTIPPFPIIFVHDWHIFCYYFRMLRYDIESKEAKSVPQTNQASLYLPSETELQTAQVSFLFSAMFL